MILKNLFTLSLFLLLSSCAKTSLKSSANTCSHTQTSFHCVKVLEVYDGDTIFIHLPDQHPLFGKRMGVRMMGIDTPEIRTKDKCEKEKGYQAKKIVQQMINNAKRVDITEVKADKYFRILGIVTVDGKNISEELIKRKLAYPYHGEKKVKRNWCE